jgi:serine/threonine-protein kinase RsbW
MSESAPAAPARSDVVEMSVPMRTEFIATLRTVAASLGADAGFSIDEIDDLRLAISEVGSSMADATSGPGRDDRIDTSYRVAPLRVEVTIRTRHGDGPVELDELASSILHSVVDEVVVDGASLTLVKLASEAARLDDTEPPTRES